MLGENNTCNEVGYKQRDFYKRPLLRLLPKKERMKNTAILNIEMKNNLALLVCS